jgi:hypothetical protein
MLSNSAEEETALRMIYYAKQKFWNFGLERSLCEKCGLTWAVSGTGWPTAASIFFCSVTVNNIWRVQVNGVSKCAKQGFCQTSTLNVKGLAIEGTGIKKAEIVDASDTGFEIYTGSNGMVIFLHVH